MSVIGVDFLAPSPLPTAITLLANVKNNTAVITLRITAVTESGSDIEADFCRYECTAFLSEFHNLLAGTVGVC